MRDKSVSIALGKRGDTVGVKGNGNGGKEHRNRVRCGGRNGHQRDGECSIIEGTVCSRRGETVEAAREGSHTVRQCDGTIVHVHDRLRVEDSKSCSEQVHACDLCVSKAAQ